MAEIETPRDLHDWLLEQPSPWATIIAVRAAMRAFPYLSGASGEWLSGSILSIIRMLNVVWAPGNVQSNIFNAYEAAEYGTDTISTRISTSGEGDATHLRLRAASSARGAIIAAAQSANTGLRPVAATFAESAAEAAVNAASLFAWDDPVLGDFGRAAYVEAFAAAFWQSINSDCDLLTSELELGKVEHARLWFNQSPGDWVSQWEALREKLLEIDPNYVVWTEWFDRRIIGEWAAFNIPGDGSRAEDTAILARLAEATDEDFWDKGHEYVNAELTRWLKEARARVAKNLPPIIADASGTFEIGGSATATLGPINSDSQDARSPQFELDVTGRIAIKSDAGSTQLRSDPQSLSRRARALQMAQKLAEALRGHNNAGYIAAIADDYIAAMVGGQIGPDPSGLVFYGDQVREAITKHRAAGPDDDLQLLPPSADRDASALLSAHNMYVGSDPFLDDLDRTTRGPDALLPEADPDEIRRVIETARRDDILVEKTYDIVIAAANAAPAIYDKNDRHSRFSSGLAQNFARYGIELLWAYPKETAWAGIATGVGVTVILGPLAAAEGTVAGIGVAYHMSRNMIANEAFYKKLLATSPAGEDNFRRLMLFLKSLPFKSRKDD